MTIDALWVGLGLTGIAAPILLSFRTYLAAIFNWMRSRLITSVMVEEGDAVYDWVNFWLSHLAYGASCLNLLTQSRHKSLHGFVLLPGNGRHIFRLNGKLVVLERVVEVVERTKKRFLVLTTFGNRRAFLEEKLIEARQLFIKEETANGIAVYRNRQGYWAYAGKIRPREIKQLVLPATLGEDLFKEITKFSSSESEYDAKGIPWRLGYLFSGPPGTGKSSLIEAIANQFGLSPYVLSLSLVTESDLLVLLGGIPPNGLLVLEDVDATAPKRPSAADTTQPGIKELAVGCQLSFSAFINSLDGIGAPTGRVMIMTTNHPENLDPALMRPGRIDRHIRFGMLTKETATRMYQLFGPKHLRLDEFLGEFVGASPAVAQAALLADHEALRVLSA